MRRGEAGSLTPRRLLARALLLRAETRRATAATYMRLAHLCIISMAAAIELLDVSQDGGVMKSIVRAGAGRSGFATSSPALAAAA